MQVKLETRDLQAILKFLDEFVSQHDDWVKGNLERLLPLMSEDLRSQMTRFRDRKHRRRYIIIGAFMFPDRYEELGDERPWAHRDNFAALAERLSPRANELLKKTENSKEQHALVIRWMRAAWSSKYSPEVPKATLEKFYRELCPPSVGCS